MKFVIRSTLIGCLLMSAPALAGAEAPDASSVEKCRAEAREISGYIDEKSSGFVSGALRGGVAGGAVAAAGGWVTGNDAGKAAKRGAVLGAVIGGARAAAKNKKSDDRKNTYERALQLCLQRTETE